MINFSFFDRLKWKISFFWMRFDAKKYVPFLLLFFVLSTFVLIYNYSPTSPKNIKKKNEVFEKLKQKKQEAFGLYSDLEQKIDENKKFVEKFKREIQALMVEIRRERLKNGVDTLNSALDNKKIKNNLLLIGEKTDYIKKVENLTKNIIAAQKELNVVVESIEADMIMAKAFSGKDVDDLIFEIDQKLSQSIPKAESSIHPKSNFKQEFFKEFWREIENER